MPVRIKICGITTWEDARVAAGLGVDALGFIFHRASPRYIAPEAAADIIRRLPPFVSKVGVFVDEEPTAVGEVVERTGIDTLQLHGSESPEYCRRFRIAVIKAFRVAAGGELPRFGEYPVSGFLLDTWDESTAGGTGRTFDWSIAAEACRRQPNIILAGGLGPSNIQEALDAVHPFGVDVNSGVEVKPGIKNPRKMHDVVKIVRSWK
jgi:phosphoribosylanthranilate isomerase